MITIGKLNLCKKAGKAQIESIIKTDGERDFLLFFEVEKEWAKYLVTDRADAFLVGILNQAMLKGHDIKCETPVSAELKTMLERQFIHILSKHDRKLYASRIYSDLTDEPLKNAGAVGTGLSLGLDSFTTIAENYNSSSSFTRLTHLLTFSKLVGGFYTKANWDFCAQKLLEREKDVAGQLNLPLISVNTNLQKFMHPRMDYWVTYLLIMAAMSLGKLFKAYFISSYGIDFSHFNVCNTALHDCECYDLLTINCCTLQGGVRFLCSGGEKDRLEKLQVISKFPLARKYLQSCLTQHYNCMTCQKCKRNLLSMDALEILDDFSEVYDIRYYRAHREQYIEWMCQQMQLQTHASEYIEPAYNLIRKREPKLIEKYTYPAEKLFSQINEFKRRSNIFQKYAKMYRELLSSPDWENKLKSWFDQRQLKNVILYGNGSATLLLEGIADRLGIKINYVVEDIPSTGGGIPRRIPRLPENTINYPTCDAIIICNVDKPWAIEKKLKEFINIPVYKIDNILKLK